MSSASLAIEQSGYHQMAEATSEETLKFALMNLAGGAPSLARVSGGIRILSQASQRFHHFFMPVGLRSD